MKNKIQLLKTKNILLLFFLFIIIINYIFCYLYVSPGFNPALIDENNNYILKNISFGFGTLIQNIMELNETSSPWFVEVKLESARRLFLPYYLIFIHEYITTNFYLIHLIKNLFFGLIIFFTIKFFDKKYNNIFLFLCIFLIYYIPHNLVTMLGTENEEGILNYLIILLFFTLLSNSKFKSLWLSIILSVIFFLKGSMFLLVTTIPICYFFYEKNEKYKIILIVTIIASNIIWGAVSYKKNGFFAFGPKGSSNNAITLAVVTHDLFNKTYPEIRPDIHMPRIEKIIKKNNISNEKVFVDTLISKSWDYIIQNPYEYFIGILKKIYVLTISPFKDGQTPDSKIISDQEYLNNIKNEIKNPEINNPVRLSNIPNKIIFNLSLILMFFSIIKNSNNSIFLRKLNFYYFFILLSYLAPYMFAFIYPRHATSVYIVAHFYCLFFLIEKNLKFSNFFIKSYN